MARGPQMTTQKTTARTWAKDYMDRLAAVKDSGNRDRLRWMPSTWVKNWTGDITHPAKGAIVVEEGTYWPCGCGCADVMEMAEAGLYVERQPDEPFWAEAYNGSVLLVYGSERLLRVK